MRFSSDAVSHWAPAASVFRTSRDVSHLRYGDDACLRYAHATAAAKLRVSICSSSDVAPTQRELMHCSK
jgi:hypothetical protein